MHRRADRAARGARRGAEGRQADLIDARLDPQRRDDKRSRVVDGLPVAGPELQLDRASTETKAEALAVVDRESLPPPFEKLSATALDATCMGAIDACGFAIGTAASPSIRTPDAAAAQ